MDIQSLSDRQRAILKFIQHWDDEHGYPPTIREIGAAVKINSTSVVNYNLNKLVKEGFISRSKDVSRGIRVVTDTDAVRPNILNVPLVGQIVAGQPAPHPGTHRVCRHHARAGDRVHFHQLQRGGCADLPAVPRAASGRRGQSGEHFTRQ